MLGLGYALGFSHRPLSCHDIFAIIPVCVEALSLLASESGHLVQFLEGIFERLTLPLLPCSLLHSATEKKA